MLVPIDPRSGALSFSCTRGKDVFDSEVGIEHGPSKAGKRQTLRLGTARACMKQHDSHTVSAYLQCCSQRCTPW